MSKYKPGDVVIINNNCVLSDWVGRRGIIVSTNAYNCCIINMLDDGDQLCLHQYKLDPADNSKEVGAISSSNDNGDGLNLL
jgi:hypothetical protein